MYTQNNNSYYEDSTDFINPNYPSSLSPLLVQSLAGDFNSINEAFILANANGNTSTGSACTSSSYIASPSSPLSCTSSHPPNTTTSTNFMQRSLSSHSLHRNGFHLPISPPTGLHDLDIGPVRRVFSTGDLDQVFLQSIHTVNKKMKDKNIHKINSFQLTWLINLVTGNQNITPPPSASGRKSIGK